MIRVFNPPDRYGELLSRLEREWSLSRIWAHDFTVWKSEPTEITNRLGWLHAPFSMVRELDRLDTFVNAVRSDGIEHVLLFGMGGSSLAPAVFARAFGPASAHPALTVLDSTHPAAIAGAERRLDLSRTLFLVATKSGTTTETLSLFRYFHRRVREAEGEAEAGHRFVAITDPGSPLVDLAARHSFRETFLNDPHIGGRYAALSLVGLIPAALLGIDAARLLERAQRTSIECARYEPLDENPAVRVGATLAASTLGGRDKATFLFPPRIAGFGDWIEQLIAESTGKEGTGILPIVGEAVASPTAYGDDRLFVSFALEGEGPDERAVSELERAGHPLIRIELDDLYSLGDQFFLWELSTAVAAHLLRVNPFDQPNVEAAKRLARELVDGFRRTGCPPSTESTPLTVDGLVAFLAGIELGSYIALQAYLPPSDRLTDAFAALRLGLRARFGLATTFGYGPRFLHSTGQLHKGDRGNGRFVQIVSASDEDLPIPDEDENSGSTLTFGTLIAAQAGGDRRALLDAGRSVSTFAVFADATETIRRVAEELGEGR